MIKGLHHSAYRCRDSEETREFYEDFLGLPLAGSLDIRESITGREVKVLHTFYGMDDGSYLAFFEAPDQPFEFKDQQDFDLHIALEVNDDALQSRGGHDLAGKAHRFQCHVAVDLGGQKVEADRRRRLRVGRSDMDAAGAFGTQGMGEGGDARVAVGAQRPLKV